MSMGVRAKIVWAIPVEVYSVAMREALTPIKGPRIVEPNAHHIALRSHIAWCNFARPSLLNNIKAKKKPAKPIKARIMVAEKGIL